MNAQVIKDIVNSIKDSSTELETLLEQYQNPDIANEELLDDIDYTLLEILKSAGMLKQYIDMDISGDLDEEEIVPDKPLPLTDLEIEHGNRLAAKLDAQSPKKALG